MPRIGLLVVTSISRIATSLRAAEKHLFNTLYIQIYSPSHQQLSLPNYNRIISKIYATSMCYTSGVDVRVVIENLRTHHSKKFHQKIDILLFDNCFPAEESKKLSMSYSPVSIIRIDDTTTASTDDTEANDSQTKLQSKMDESNNSMDQAVYDNVVLGGTFDRLHIGHKILLTEAVLRCKKRLVVGVTDDAAMIKNKKLRELILPVGQRIENVQEFLKDIDNTLEYDVVPIHDAYGPTRTDPNLDLLIVSAETMRGGEAVNRVRTEANLRPLEIYCIELIESVDNHENDDGQIKEIKISSSNQRIDLLGTRLRQPEPRLYMPSRPYIIGLIGGIASGKSDVSQRLSKLGAEIIDCDKLAHQLYEPGELCYNEIIQYFGKNILDADGRVNRKKLGEIVFGNAEKLTALNSIVWPALLDLVLATIHKQFSQTKCDVIVIEAAILIRAGWQTECHEIWSTMLAKDEAVVRLMKRNNLTQDEAQKRINSQESNEDIVRHSHVVFSSQYGFEFTQIQVERAWKSLMDHLKS